jgi:hypothetical protein
VIVNNLTVEMALAACHLIGEFPITTVYSRVAVARERGTYDVLKLREEQEIRSLVIEIDGSNDPIASDNSRAVSLSSSCRRRDPTISPVTMATSTTTEESTTETGTEDDSSSSQKSKQVFRKSSRQASTTLLESKIAKTEYDQLYKAAFKEATNLVAAAVAGTIPSEPVKGICDRLNTKFGLVSNPAKKQKQLARSTIYQAAKDGMAGKSPKKRGPPSIIPDTLLKVLATHAEVCQVGDGELKGKDMQRLIGASTLGTEYEDRFEIDSVWRKVRKEYPQALQAATKMTVEDARAQWTTHDNLNQWFDDVKADLLSTGMVVDEIELDENGQLLSEVRFSNKPNVLISTMDNPQYSP